MSKKVLIIEDDQEINLLLQVLCKKNGYMPISAYSGSEGVLQLRQQSVDLVLLDLMLPGLNGEEVLQEIRQKQQTPVIVISAKQEMSQKIELLKLGADDYITKPFNQEEVAARMEVQLRKSNLVEKAHIKQWRNILLDKDKVTVSLNDEPLVLTNAEFDILDFLLTHPEKALSKKDIYEAVWKGTYFGDDNTVSVHVSNLRKKMFKITKDDYIQTVWGIGFMLI